MLIDEDEEVVNVYNEKDFKNEVFYIMVIKNGMIKKSSVL